MSLAGNHHKIHYIEFAASDVARAKQFYSALVTRSAGNYSLIELRFALRNEGNITQDASISSIVELLA